MKTLAKLVFVHISPILLLSCMDSQENYLTANQNSEECASDGETTYICGLMNAEDLISVAGTDLIITTGMASSALTDDEEVNGHIYLINTEDDSWEDLVSKPS